MKMSKREKIMLSILIVVFIGFIYYKFIYLNQIKIIESKSENKTQLEEKYNNTINTINSLYSKESKIKVLNAKVSNRSSNFYPTISQEHLIIELDKLLKSSGLDGGFIFNNIEVAEVPKTEKNQENLKESTVKQITEEYNEEINNAIKKNISNLEDNKFNNESKIDNSSDDSDKKSNELEQIKFELNFSGNYLSLNDFLTSIRNYERKISVNSITISEKSIDEITGTMNLEIYAIPKIDDDLEKYLNWTINNTYGKVSPFSLDCELGGINNNNESTENDFLISVKSITSELPSIIIGKGNDKFKDTYIYGNINDVGEAELIITKIDDKYYYKYKVCDETYPYDYNEIGKEFIPNGDNINLKILSESRVNTEDKSGIRISITNKTDKLIAVEIDNDDLNNARVSISGDSKNISVSNK